jgi:D-galactose 1-dehydrogenase
MAGGRPIRIGIVGVGKIARDQHLPVIGRSADFVLTAAASRNAAVEGTASYPSLPEMLDAHPEIEAVSLCTPPQGRRELAALALARGKHVMLEKPPASTLTEVEDLRVGAERAGRTLFATWHSRFAPCVEPARRWLADRRIASVRIDWREDVRRWHPGQAWIWEPGGLGVFDPGINALSIATRILPRPFFLQEGVLRFPENRQAPVAADLLYKDAEGAPVEVGLDWLQTGPQVWDIRVETDGGTLLLSQGGGRMEVDGRLIGEAPEAEYEGLYARFARLIGEERSDVDVSPLRLVADAFLGSRREIVEPFAD